MVQCEVEFNSLVAWPPSAVGRVYIGASDWFQLVHDQITLVDGLDEPHVRDTDGFVLDVVVPYNGPAGDFIFFFEVVSLSDKPAVFDFAEKCKRHERTFAAKAYLMARPNGGIWVPVGQMVEWGFTATASPDAGNLPNWEITASSASLTDHPGVTTIPTWHGNAIDSDFQPPLPKEGE